MRRNGEWDLYSEQAERLAKAYYYANVSFIDEQIGRILTVAHETGALDDTLIVFTSDHGELLGDHWLWFKQQAYEGSLRVPLIVWGPRWIQGDTRSDALTSLLDVFPTFWNRATAGEQTARVTLAPRPGRDLVELAAGQGLRDEPQFMEVSPTPNRLLAVRTRDWKYAWHENGGVEELFDLRNDPAELTNLGNDPGYTARRHELRTLLVDWVRRASDPAHVLSPEGKLPSRQFTTRTEPGASPFSRLPWQLRVPPRTLSGDARVPWWWRDRVDHRSYVEESRQPR
ncbi:MAG: sulfatase-like hydrolase/transferase [Chloroflexi bacterium]|nr:sulfatase-like hydrolase/transferase [Chloroflexota bacterium]